MSLIAIINLLWPRKEKTPIKGQFINWQERKDSNPQPSVLETAALPLELRSCNVRILCTTLY